MGSDPSTSTATESPYKARALTAAKKFGGRAVLAFKSRKPAQGAGEAADEHDADAAEADSRT